MYEDTGAMSLGESGVVWCVCACVCVEWGWWRGWMCVSVSVCACMCVCAWLCKCAYITLVFCLSPTWGQPEYATVTRPSTFPFLKKQVPFDGETLDKDLPPFTERGEHSQPADWLSPEPQLPQHWSWGWCHDCGRLARTPWRRGLHRALGLNMSKMGNYPFTPRSAVNIRSNYTVYR